MKKVLLSVILLTACGAAEAPVIVEEVPVVEEMAGVFAVTAPEGFSETVLGDGILLRKDDVEMVFMEVDGEFETVSEFVGKRYPGYTLDYKFDGFFVDEDIGEEAVRHFFVMKGRNLYEGYLRIPAFKYSEYQPVFDEVIAGMEIN